MQLPYIVEVSFDPEAFSPVAQFVWCGDAYRFVINHLAAVSNPEEHRPMFRRVEDGAERQFDDNWNAFSRWATEEVEDDDDAYAPEEDAALKEAWNKA